MQGDTTSLRNLTLAHPSFAQMTAENFCTPLCTVAALVPVNTCTAQLLAPTPAVSEGLVYHGNCLLWLILVGAMVELCPELSDGSCWGKAPAWALVILVAAGDSAMWPVWHAAPCGRAALAAQARWGHPRKALVVREVRRVKMAQLPKI